MSTTRRGLLGGAAALAAAPSASALTPQLARAAAARHADADLILRCAELQMLSAEGARLAALPRDAAGRWEAIGANDDTWQAKMAEAAVIPAQTLDGLRARVAALGEYIIPDLKEAMQFWGDPPVVAMLGMLLADLTEERT